MTLMNTPRTTQGRSERPLLKEIASLAGVSKSTASKALNGRSGVSQQARDRVLRFARMMGYRPNPLVRAFHRRSSRMIGLYTRTALAGYAFMRAASGVAAALSRQGYHAALIMDAPGGSDDVVPEIILDGYIDGLIVFDDTPEHVLQIVNDYDIACAQILSDPNHVPNVRVVTCDPAPAVRHAVDHLVTKGHRHIAGVFVGSVPEGHEAKVRSPSYPWTRGYLEAMAAHGLPAVTTEDPTLDVSTWLGQVRDECAGLTAVIAQDVDSARDLKSEIVNLGLSVPADLSVICTDPSGAALDPGSLFTGVDVPYERIGQEAAEALLDRLGGRFGEGWSGISLAPVTGIIDFGTVRRLEDANGDG